MGNTNNPADARQTAMRTARFNQLYERSLEASRLKCYEVEEALGVTPPTLLSRRNAPLDARKGVRLGELAILASLFGWTDEEILSFIRGT